MSIIRIDYEEAFLNTNDAGFILDLQGIHVNANQKACNLLGYTQQEIIGLSYKDVSIEIPQSTQILEGIKGNEVYPVYKRLFKKKNGDIIPVEINICMIHDEDGNPAYIQSIVRDITKQTSEQDKLKQMLSFSSLFINQDRNTINVQQICDDFMKLCNARFVAFNLYNIDGLTYKTVALSGDKGMISAASRLWGEKIQGKEWAHDPVRAERIKSNIVTRFITLSDLTGTVIPRRIVILLMSVFNLGETTVVKVMKAQKMIGDFTIIMSKSETFNEPAIAVVFANQIGLLIDRIRSEEVVETVQNQLKESEEQYRMLFSEMKQGIALHEISRKNKKSQKSFTFIQANVKYLEFLGLESSEIVQQESKVVLSKLPLYLRKFYKEVIEMDFNRDYEFYFAVTDKHYRVLKYKPNPLQFALIIDDITDEKKITTFQELERHAIKNQKITDQSKTVVWEVNQDGLYTYVSPGVSQMWGYTQTELINKVYFYMLHPEKNREAFKLEAMGFFSKKSLFQNLENQIQTKSGKIIYVSTNGSPVIDEFGIYTGYQGSDIDITKFKEAEERIYQQNELVRGLFNHVSQAIVIFQRVVLKNQKPDYIIREYNRVTEIWEKSKKENLIGKNLSRITPAMRHMDMFEDLEKVWTTELPIHSTKKFTDKNNKTDWYEIQIFKLPTGEIVSIYDNVTNRIGKEEAIMYANLHDYQTDLLNRRAFDEELNHINHESSLPLSIIVGDINGLKVTNDAFGHEVGDQIIMIVSDVLKRVFGTPHIVARIGGDDFSIICPNTSNESAKILVNQAKMEIESVLINHIPISISFGFYTKYDCVESLNIFKMAEEDLYTRKLFEVTSHRASLVKNILLTLGEKNPREEAHSKRVSLICKRIGKGLGMDSDELGLLKAISYLHDIGKIGIDEAILNKPGKLDEREWEIIKKHPEIGYRILSATPEYSQIALDILSHHERFDGKGYPRGLVGEDIPRRARIISIADSYDAMVSLRTYRPPFTHQEAIDEIKRNSGFQFDPSIVNIFLEIFENQIPLE